MLKKYHGLFLILIALATSFQFPAAAEPDRPNLLYIVVDEMREMAMSCSGDQNLYTPSLDQLAGSGVRFNRMYTPYPVCSPARASIHTGMFPHNAGVPHNGYHLRETLPTLAEILSDAGYYTGHIGKWHLEGETNVINAYVPPSTHRGFQYWAGYEHGHQYFGSHYWMNDSVPLAIPAGVYEPDFQTDLAIEFIRKYKGGSWYLDLNFGAPHFPLEKDNVMAEDLALFDPGKIILRPNVPSDFENEAKESLSVYYAMIHNIDRNVGRIMQVLETEGMLQNTLVIFTSDHGDMMLSHGQHYKRRPQEESARVPFIISYPEQFPHGRVAGQYLTLVDVFPTILDVLHVKAPLNEGSSFAPVLLGLSEEEVHESLYLGCAWFGCRDYDPGLHMKMPWRAIRTKDFMMAFLKISDSEVQPVQLYDMAKDPYQMNNLVDDPAYEEARAYLTGQFNKWRKQTGDSEFGKIMIVGN